jgi:hypothetical protein
MAMSMDMAMPDLAPQMVQLSGAVQKGPFVLGSAIQISTVDNAANPLGQVFPTQTTDDLGNFSLALAYQGIVSIEGSGYYYNEATGKLSDASLTLRAFYDVQTTPVQNAYVNLVTHLTYGRVKTLMTGTPAMSLADATQQAEGELLSELGIGGTGFDPKAHGVDMNIAGGDNDANAYLFAVGAIFAEVAVATANGASVDATLQQLINTVSSSFATTGQVSPTLKVQIFNAQKQNDYHLIMQNFGARLASVQSSATVPDLGRVWDTDGDTYPDAKDNCPLISNPTQAAVSGLCNYVVKDFPGLVNGNGPDLLVTGDFTGDGSDDVLYGEDNLQVFVGDGAGGLATSPITTALVDRVAQCGPPSSQACEFPGPNPTVIDADGDGKLDLVANILTHDGNTGIFYGDGTGHFSTPLSAVSPILYTGGVGPTASYSRLNYFGVADFDGDGKKDLVGSLYSSNDQLFYVLATGARSFGAGTRISFGSTPIQVTGIVTGDFTGDGNVDIVVASTTGSATAGLFLLTNLGSTAGTFNGFSVGAPITTVGTTLGAISAADLNGDHKPDVLVTSNLGLVPMIGDGAGNLTAGTPPGTKVAINSALAIGDFTGDGKDDLILPDFSDPGTSAAYWNGTGFDVSPIPFLPNSAGLPAHFNHDAKMDLLVRRQPLVNGSPGPPLFTTILLNP